MSHRMKVKELVPHRRLPDWCLEILAEIKGAWMGVPTELPCSAIGTIGSMIGVMRFSGLGHDNFSGASVPMKEEDGGKALTIYSRTGNTALVKIYFEEER